MYVLSEASVEVDYLSSRVGLTRKPVTSMLWVCILVLRWMHANWIPFELCLLESQEMVLTGCLLIFLQQKAVVSVELPIRQMS
jgi:hypothetical protein